MESKLLKAIEIGAGVWLTIDPPDGSDIFSVWYEPTKLDRDGHLHGNLKDGTPYSIYLEFVRDVALFQGEKV